MSRIKPDPWCAVEIADLEIDGRKYVAAISRFSHNNKIAQIFLTTGKYGADVHVHAQDSAVLASLCLQHGVPVETIIHAIRGPIGRALELFVEAHS